VATDIRLNDVIDFTRAHLAAEAALTIAALGESDDDTYLEVEQRAKGYYAPGASPLGPLESRWATPGGTTPTANIDDTDSVKPGALYAVGEIDDDNWVALVGARRDPAGVSLAEALLIRRTPAGLRIVGRAAVDPFKENLTFEPVGGEPVDPGLVQRVIVLTEPSYPGHTEFVRAWGGGASHE
jgi:hypothetical protein